MRLPGSEFFLVHESLFFFPHPCFLQGQGDLRPTMQAGQVAAAQSPRVLASLPGPESGHGRAF